MARKPDEPSKPLREWRISILRDKTHYLGRVIAADEDAALDRAMEEFRIDAANRFRMTPSRSSDGAGADGLAIAIRHAPGTYSTGHDSHVKIVHTT